MWLGLRDFLLIVPSSALIGVSAKRLYIIHGHAPSSFAPSRDQITECFGVPAEHNCKIDLGHFLSRVARSAAPAAEPSYPAWKAAAIKALQRLHAPATLVTRDGL